MSDRPPLFQYWHTKDVPAEIKERLNLVRTHNVGMRHVLLDWAAARALIEESLGTRKLAAFDSCAVPAMQADYFRYCAVYSAGGVYCDADVRCLGSFDRLLEGDGNLFERSVLGLCHNQLFGFYTPFSPLLELTIEIATQGIEQRLVEKVSVVTGPAIFTALATAWRFGLDELAELLGPWHWAVGTEERSWLRQLDLVRSVIGDHATVARAFEGVRLLPSTEMRDLLVWNERFEYKRTRRHHPSWPGSIFR